MIDIIPFASSSSGNCYLLKQNENNYLIECGVKGKQIQKYLLSKSLLVSSLKGCFITHNHTDHILSCKWINEYMPIYSNREVIESNSLNGKILDSSEPFSLDDMKVLPFEVEHNGTQNYAYIFKDNEDKVLFITDFMKFNQNISKIKFNKIYIECNYDDEILENILTNETEDNISKYKRQINAHMSLNNLIIHLENMDLSCCKKITLLHRSKWCLTKTKAIEKLKEKFNLEFEFAREK